MLYFLCSKAHGLHCITDQAFEALAARYPLSRRLPPSLQCGKVGDSLLCVDSKYVLLHRGNIQAATNQTASTELSFSFFPMLSEKR